MASKVTETVWIRLSVDFADHPKIAGLSDHAFRALIEMLTYCRRFSQDGTIPARLVHQRWGQGITQSVTQTGTETITDSVSELLENDVERPSLVREGNFYRLHDYSEWQETKSQIEARKARNQANGARGGRPKKTQSVSGSVSDSVTETITETKPKPKAEIETETEVLTNVSTLIPLSSKSARKKPPTPIPDDWQPTEAHHAKAQEFGLNLSLESQKFINHAQANDRRQVDWNKSFHGWLLKASEYATRPRNGGGSSYARNPAQEALDLAREFYEAEQQQTRLEIHP